MKSFIFVLLFASPVFACVTPSPVLNVKSLLILPGYPTPYQDGSLRAPFISLKNAIVHGKIQNFCTTSIKLANGNHYYDGSAITSNVDIIGSDRALTLIKGGLFVMGAYKLSLEKVTLSSTGTRLIYVKGGELKLKEVTIKDYVFKPLRPYARPSAIQIVNSVARITGLEALNSEQPILRVEGSGSRVKAAFFTIYNSSLSDYADNLATPAQYSAAVEVADGALANFLITDINTVEFAGITVKGSRFYGAQVAIRNIFKSNPETKTIVSGLFAFNSTVHLNGYRVNNSSFAGIGIVESFVTLQNGVLAWNNYGLVDINDKVNNQNGYDTLACANSIELKAITENNSILDYRKVGANMPIPNAPPPVACPPTSDCPQTAPAPVPEKPPVICPLVERI